MFACWLDTLTREKLVDGWKNKLWHVVSFSFNEIHSITSIVWRATAIADMTFWSGRVFWKRQATLPPVVTGGRQEFSGAKIRGPNITGEIFHVQIFIFPQIFFHAQISSRADFFTRRFFHAQVFSRVPFTTPLHYSYSPFPFAAFIIPFHDSSSSSCINSTVSSCSEELVTLYISSFY